MQRFGLTKEQNKWTHPDWPGQYIEIDKYGIDIVGDDLEKYVTQSAMAEIYQKYPADYDKLRQNKYSQTWQRISWSSLDGIAIDTCFESKTAYCIVMQYSIKNQSVIYYSKGHGIGTLDDMLEECRPSLGSYLRLKSKYRALKAAK